MDILKQIVIQAQASYLASFRAYPQSAFLFSLQVSVDISFFVFVVVAGLSIAAFIAAIVVKVKADLNNPWREQPIPKRPTDNGLILAASRSTSFARFTKNQVRVFIGNVRSGFAFTMISYSNSFILFHSYLNLSIVSIAYNWETSPSQLALLSAIFLSISLFLLIAWAVTLFVIKVVFLPIVRMGGEVLAEALVRLYLSATVSNNYFAKLFVSFKIWAVPKLQASSDKSDADRKETLTQIYTFISLYGQQLAYGFSLLVVSFGITFLPTLIAAFSVFVILVTYTMTIQRVVYFATQMIKSSEFRASVRKNWKANTKTYLMPSSMDSFFGYCWLSLQVMIVAYLAPIIIPGIGIGLSLFTMGVLFFSMMMSLYMIGSGKSYGEQVRYEASTDSN